MKTDLLPAKNTGKIFRQEKIRKHFFSSYPPTLIFHAAQESDRAVTKIDINPL